MKLSELLLVAVATWPTIAHAAVPVSWINPVAYTDDTPLLAADIVATNIYCTGSGVAPGPAGPLYERVYTIAGNGTTGSIPLTGPRWCGKSTVAYMPVTGPGEREKRESDITVPVLMDELRPKPGAGPVRNTVPPTNCQQAAGCPLN